MMEKRNDIDYLIFDLDGTLLDTALYIVLNYVHLFEKYHIKTPSLTDFVYFSGPPLTEIFATYFKGIPVAELAQEFENFSLEHANHFSSLYEGEKEVLSKLKKVGYRLAVLTSKRRRPTMDNLSYFDILKDFDDILALEDYPRPKPDPVGIDILLEKTGMKRERAFIIGDSASDILCGKNAHVHTGLVTFGLKKTQDIPAEERYASYADIERSFIHER